MKTNYLDFNDIVFNVLGAMVGVVLLMGLRKPGSNMTGTTRYEAVFGKMFRLSMLLSALVVLVAGLFGRIVMLVEQAKDRSVLAVVNGKLSFIMSFERHDKFWIKSYFGKVFHVLSVGDGLAVIAVLCLGAWLAVRWLRSGGAD
jgi:hypothetical protein